jgi:DNA polymerase V
MAIFALVDCNNFYASCERVFDPSLQKRPLVILSNNDGCVIARSQEAKDRGIAMGAPWFQIRKEAERKGVVARSSNYPLYGDLSERVMSILAEAAPATEVYSIDECFLDLSGMACVDDLTDWCRALCAKVRQWTGIPISIGVGSTKTLAKIANKIAKKSSKANGVLDLVQHCGHLKAALEATNVSDVWGVGRQWSAACQRAGIRTAWDFANAPERWVRANMGAVGLRTVLELRGVAVHTLDTQPQARQTCCCSRSFGALISDHRHVQDAVVEYAARAAEKMRADGLVAAAVQVFIQTDRFRTEDPQYSSGVTVRLEAATAATPAIISAAVRGLGAVWREGYLYRKAGVILLDLMKPDEVPRDLFATDCQPSKATPLMHALDAANGRFGRGTVTLGHAPKDAPWRMRQEFLSPSYTTQWRHIPTAKA